MIIESDVICTSVNLYAIIICTDSQQYTCVNVSFWLVHVLYAIGYMCSDCSMCIYVDTSKLCKNIISLLVS